MKKLTIVVIVVITIVAIAIGCYFLFIQKNLPDEYQATAMSASWPVHTNDQYGFHIKYPDINWSVESDFNGASFSPDFEASLGVYAGTTSINAAMAQVRNSITGRCSADGTSVLINGSVAKRMNCVVGYFDNGGTSDRTFLYLEKDGLTYEISFDPGRGKDKNDPVLKSEFNEMVGTFGFNQIKQPDRGLLKFVDPRYGFSFTYPSTWRVVSGGTPLILDSSLGDRIEIYVISKTTLEQYQQFQGSQISGCTAKQEYFVHKIMGQQCDWLGKKTYFFEKDGDLYSIGLADIVSLKSVIDGILNSFTL
jgi:hypothetical protein